MEHPRFLVCHEWLAIVEIRETLEDIQEVVGWYNGVPIGV